MTITEELWSAVAVAAHDPLMAGPYLEGSRLSWAAARVLGAQGAGISVLIDPSARMSLGASSAVTATAERWQYVAGEGPGLDAHATRRPIVADEPTLALRWPGFAEHLRSHTPFRSVGAVPLFQVGTVVLYFTDAQGYARVDPGDMDAVARDVWIALVQGQGSAQVDSWPGRQSPAARFRARVWVAMGMLGVGLDLDHGSALAVLRDYARHQGRTAEQVAGDLVSGVLDTGQLRGRRPPDAVR